MRKYIVLGLLTLSYLLVYGQNEREGVNISSIAPQFISPQVADMIRYDNTPVSLNSGRVDLQIPVLNKFSDKDFSFPISLSYNSSGFKPSEPEGNVGLHWSLIAGGTIYREVRGVPDDYDGTWCDQEAHHIRGFLRLAKDYTTGTTAQSMFENPTGNISHDYWLNIATLKDTEKIEASSDIYRFSFGNHSGKFIIDFDGLTKSVAYSGGKVKVDISGYYLVNNVQSDNSGKSEIRITTDDGYIYCFGGSYSAMEYTAFTWDERLTVSGIAGANPPNQAVDNIMRHNTVNAFQLYKIIAPNGRILKINYKTYADNKTSPTNAGRSYHAVPWDLYNYSYEDNNKELQMCYLLRQSKYGYGNNIFETMALNKIALIESIELDDKIVKFYHSHKTSTMYETSAIKDFIFGRKTGAQLDSVCLYLKDNTKQTRIESTGFSYIQQGRRQFLEQLNNSITGKYKFSYNSQGNTISPLTIDYDHWGYWNGTGTNSSLVINTLYDRELYDFQYGNRRPASTDIESSATLLNEITYPTGGYKKFIYERHECLYALELDLFTASVSIPRMRSHGTRKVGGSRIKQIISYDNNGPEQTKDYIYAISPLKDDGTYISSGELMHVPLYTFPFQNDYNSGSNYSPFLSPSSSYGFNERPYDTDHVRYKSVLEYNNLKRTHHKVNDETIGKGISPSDAIRKATLKVNTKDVPQTWVINGRGKGQFFGQAGTASIRISEANSNKPVMTYYFYGGTYTNGYSGDPLYGTSTQDRRLRLNANTDYIIEIECIGPADMQNGAYATANITYKTGYEYDTVEPDQYKQIIFTCYGNAVESSNPDDYNNDKLYTNDIIINGKWIGGINDPIIDNLYRSITKKPQDRSVERGKIKEEKYYSKDRQLVKNTIYEYRPMDNNILGNYSVYVNTPSFFMNTKMGYYSQVNKEYFYQYYLASQKTTEYRQNSNILETLETYSYDVNGDYIKEKSVKNSNGVTTKVNYSYPFDKIGTIYNEMVKANIVAPVIDKTVATGNSIQQIITDYQKDAVKTKNLILPKSVTTKINTNSRVDLAYDLYDGKGNIQQITGLDGIPVVYLWSYNYQYPIAEIKNATLTEVTAVLSSVFGVSTADALSALTTPNEAKLKDGSLQKALPNALVTTYTYKPLVGILTATDSAGLTTTYEYDTFGRLIRIKDPAGKIIQSYNYHYQNQ
ncbi:MAG: RHS repeat protein [Prevotella sp.]|jgi:YD repeat-containing protein|nr:RHS repeat protein [Prevotella sp.]